MEQALAIAGVILFALLLTLGRRALWILTHRADHRIRDAARDARWRGSQRRMDSVDDAPATTACVACESQDLDVVGPAAYRCRACGYEGGSGWAAIEQARRREVWMTRPLDERKRAAVEDLVAARRLMAAADAPIIGGGHGLAADRSLEEQGQEALRRRLLDAVGHLLEAEAKLQGLGLIPEDADVADAILNARHRDLDLLRGRIERRVSQAIANVAGHR